ncbi:MAG: hypothetical protein ACLKAK_11395 [Alkaliphilus sp.]
MGETENRPLSQVRQRTVPCLKKITDRLAGINNKRYENLMCKAVELDLISKEDLKQYAKLFHMLNSSIIEQLILNDDFDYEEMWGKLVERLFER